MSGYLNYDKDDSTPAGRILGIIRRAGDAYCHTEGWQYEGHDGETPYVDQIESVVRKEVGQLEAENARFKEALITLATDRGGTYAMNVAIQTLGYDPNEEDGDSQTDPPSA